MPVQLSEEEGVLETAVKAMKSPFMTSVVIIRHKKKFFHFPSYPRENWK